MSSTTPAAPTVPTAPTAPTSSSVATGSIKLGSSAVTAALPSIVGVTGSITMPAIDTPGGVTVNIETTGIAPADAPSLQGVQAQLRRPLSGALDAVFFMTLQSPITITLSTLPGITIDLPQSTATAGQFFYGFTDTTVHDVAAAVRTEGPASEIGTSFTFAPSPNPLTLQAGQRVTFAFFANVEEARGPGLKYVDYTGTPRPSLDAIQGTGEYSPSKDMFSFEAKMAGNIVDGNTNFFVWGVDRGGGTNTFPDEPNVLFNAVVVAVVGPTGAIATSVVNLLPATGPPVPEPFPASNVFVSGPKIQVRVPGSLLPSTGLSPGSYRWNLWPRIGIGGAPSAQIQDFLPENAMAAMMPAK